MGHLKNHFDIADNEIKPGDFVVYAALWDRSATLKYGIVTRLAERPESGWKENEKYTIRILSADRSTEWTHHKGGPSEKKVSWEIQKRGKDGRPLEVTLGFLDRLLVVPPSQVPSQARAILMRALEERPK